MVSESITNLGKYAPVPSRTDFENAAAGLANTVGRGLQTIPNTLGKGFEYGEKANLIGNWLVAKDRAVADLTAAGKKVDYRSREFIDLAAFYARQQTGYMGTKSGRPLYSDGLTGMFLQYASVTHKATALMLPKEAFGMILGSDAPARVKYSYLASALTMYGLDGIGLMPIVNRLMDSSGIDRDKYAQEIKTVESGLIEMIVNQSLDANIDVSAQSFFHGNMIMGFLNNLFTQPASNTFQNTLSVLFKNPADMTGAMPVSSVVGSYFQTVKDLYHIVNTNQTDSTDKAVQSVLAIGNVAPIVRNSLIAYRSEQYDSLINKKGDVVLKDITTAELISKAAFGTTTNTESALYAMYEGGPSATLKLEKDLKESGKEMYKAAKRQFVLISGVDWKDPVAKQKALQDWAYTYLDVGNSYEMHKVRESFFEASFNDSGEDALTRQFNRFVQSRDKTGDDRLFHDGDKLKEAFRTLDRKVMVKLIEDLQTIRKG
jgi:hypothetical protein